jgi:hypothetical protein
MKKIAIAVVLIVISAIASEAQEEGSRGFIFELGLGLSTVSYGDADSYIAAATSLGIDRLDLGIDLGLGWAVSRNAYVLAVLEGEATRLSDSYGNWIQINSYLFGGGVRWYPWHTGLILGLDAGLARMSADASDGSSAVNDSTGWGAAAILAYDFNSRATGFSLVLGVKVNYFSIGIDRVTAATLFLSLVWK